MDDELVTKLYRVRRSILEVLSDRGYLVLDEELKQTKEEFRKKFGDDPKKEKLLISKKRRESNECDGHLICSDGQIPPFCMGGPGYLLNRLALTRLGPHFDTDVSPGVVQ